MRTSKRQQVINRVDEITDAAAKQYYTSQLLGVYSPRAEEILVRLKKIQKCLANSRYLFRSGYRKREPKFAKYLDEHHIDGLNDREFKFHFRMSRECYWQLVELIKDHSSFSRRSSDSRGSTPRPAEQQLLVLLKYYGSDGNASSSYSLGNFFGISSGAVDTCRYAALEAVLSLEERTYFWPPPEERKLISKRIKEAYLFPKCVGIIDGTLLPLASRPLLHGETYLSRKRYYALVMLVVCDDQSRILYYHVGWPGSVHDNRVWRTCRLYRHWEEMFSPREYLLGDSAFTASDIMIPPFKSTPGCELPSNFIAFNTLLAKPRVKSEHCIGILKGRFPFLKGIRMILGCKGHLKRIVDHVRGSVVLHNFLIADPIDTEWIESGEEGADDLEPEGIANQSNKPDNKRREELLYYLSELEETAIN